MLKSLLFIIALSATSTLYASTPSILVLGDSLSAGYGIDLQHTWVALLQKRLQEQEYPHRVVNASISGDTTRNGRTRLKPLLQQYRPLIVILELGANDGLRALSLNAMRDNLSEMIRIARTQGASVLLIGIHLPPNYGPEYTQKFDHIYTRLARELDVPLVPFLLEGVALNAELMQTDGVHPRAEAQPRMLENVWPKLRPLLKKDVPAKAATK